MSLEKIRNRASGQNLQAASVIFIGAILRTFITLAEVKEVLDANPNHPKAVDLRAFYDEHSRFLPQETVIAVEKAVVLGILDGGAVVEKTTNVTTDGREVVQTQIEEANHDHF